MYELNHQNFAASHGVLMNSNGGFYQHGKSYGMDTKLLVATKYLEHNARLGGLRPVLTEVAEECRVGRDFVECNRISSSCESCHDYSRFDHTR